MPTVYIAVGSNIGDRAHNLREAVHLLDRYAIRVKKVSSVYETEPVDYLDQPWFLNAALRAETRLSPRELLTALRQIESHMGSHKLFPKGPRLIDLDILLYDDLTIDEADLQIPHPRMLQRNFVLAPLAEIGPDLRHPSWPSPAAELLAQSSDRSAVRKLTSAHKK